MKRQVKGSVLVSCPKFKNKKVLFLCGATTGSVEMVNYLKAEGAIVYVADYLATEDSPAKKIADQHFLVSTLDYEAVKNLAISLHVNAIFCGLHERTLCVVESICRELGLPCYFTKYQWQLIENKTFFKEFCNKYGVGVPFKYNINSLEDIHRETISYPVIVKPVDCCGSFGISICKDKKELIDGFSYAFSKSFSHSVIVEKYIEGQEFTATYNVVNGKVALLSLYERLINDACGIGISDCCFFPTVYLKSYMEKMNCNVIKMIEGLGMTTGTCFFQGIVDKNNDFFLFEGALRLGGPETWRIDDAVNGFSAMRLVIDYSVLGKTYENIENEDPFMKGKYCYIVKLLTKGGLVNKIEGIDTILSLRTIVGYTLDAEVGKKIGKTDIYPRRSIIARFFIVSDTKEEAIDTIVKIYSYVHIFDDCGNNMIITPKTLYKKLGL